ncbi:MAG: hypothetical protein HC930_15590, partial [Hydrococcus sp. SU_1_0]|nr:hypothetical protein [Hydrococcus sp. SU_1_0]
MKSAKVVNKILLISLAFGSVTLIAGMFAGENQNLQKALFGVGGSTSVASVAGMLATKGNKKSDESQEERESDDQLAELETQESILHQSVTEDTDNMQVVETNVSSFSAEHNQLWEDPAPDLNSEQQNSETQDISASETQVQDIEAENDYLNSKFQELVVKNEILEQVISPIEEESFQKTSLQPEQNSVEDIEEITENLGVDINPFANSADLSESHQSEEVSDLEVANKLIGAFDQTELNSFGDASDQESNESSSDWVMEDEESPEEESGFVDESAMSFEPDELTADDSSESIYEMEEEESPAAESSFDEPSEISFESDAIAAGESSEPIEELWMEDE